MFLRSPLGRAAIEKSATGNQFSMRNLSQEALRSIVMPWPVNEERVEILQRIENSFAALNKVAAEQRRAAELLPKLNQTLLAKAFRGELFPQDPLDEPAAALLERIRARSRDGVGRKRR
jgi:type I restriction enzyme S subunit